jgi:hypothetical protein
LIKKCKTLLAVFALMLASACATRPSYPISYYEPPVEGELASIVGQDTRNAILPFIFDNNTTFVESVDGLPIRAPRETGKTPLNLSAGKHSINVAQQMGAFHGGTTFQLEVKKGARYVVHSQQDTEGTTFWTRQVHEAGGPTFFWIEDANTGEKATDQVRIMVNADQRGMAYPIYIPKSK